MPPIDRRREESNHCPLSIQPKRHPVRQALGDRDYPIEAARDTDGSNHSGSVDTIVRRAHLLERPFIFARAPAPKNSIALRPSAVSTTSRSPLGNRETIAQRGGHISTSCTSPTSLPNCNRGGSPRILPLTVTHCQYNNRATPAHVNMTRNNDAGMNWSLKIPQVQTASPTKVGGTARSILN